VETPKKPTSEEIKLDMTRSIIAEPLLSDVTRALQDPQNTEKFDVIISINEFFPGGISGAMREVVKRASEWNVDFAELSPYVFACLSAKQLLLLAQEARALTATYGRSGSVVYRIWQDQEVHTTLTKSISTIKADAAHRSFQAHGEGIVWAVLDSGIQGDHPHFRQTQPHFLKDTDEMLPLLHLDFTPAARKMAGGQATTMASDRSALEDLFGHGTHVAGIIAGGWESDKPGGEDVVGTELRDEADEKKTIQQRERLTRISGVAPKTKLLSLKVIADRSLTDVKQTPGQGKVSWILMAIDQIQRWNQYGKRLLVHGVNMSLGYEFDPRWFACGQSPLCVEVNRLVRSGVVVVVSAGNGGYTSLVTAGGNLQSRYSSLSITDPGNAEMAITVGSTHREKPHVYGVSYFSSRGPTGDGRMKPDLLAPGERIVSCAAGIEKAKYAGVDATAKPLPDVLYCEQTGTSMAAPHVSGAIAAFLSVRSEFIGEPERVKEFFMANTIDLGRERCFQGAGLMDLMKVLQAV
jgi:subtilisin family serine protease